jgi:hypothetical protein
MRQARKASQDPSDSNVSHDDRSPEADIASEALERAREDRLVPEGELDSLTVRVPEKIKLWR